jgi:hypothetical protein
MDFASLLINTQQLITPSSYFVWELKCDSIRTITAHCWLLGLGIFLLLYTQYLSMQLRLELFRKQPIADVLLLDISIHSDMIGWEFRCK